MALDDEIFASKLDVSEGMLVAIVGADAFVGEPLAYLLGGDVDLARQRVRHVLVRVRIVLVVDEPLVEYVDHIVGEETIAVS
jgi:hypothetical protein